MRTDPEVTTCIFRIRQFNARWGQSTAYAQARGWACALVYEQCRAQPSVWCRSRSSSLQGTCRLVAPMWPRNDTDAELSPTRLLHSVTSDAQNNRLNNGCLATSGHPRRRLQADKAVQACHFAQAMNPHGVLQERVHAGKRAEVGVVDGPNSKSFDPTRTTILALPECS